WVDLIQLLACLDLAAFGEQTLLDDAVDLRAYFGDAIGAGTARHFAGQGIGFGFERDNSDLGRLLSLGGAGFLATGKTERCHGDGGNQDSEGWLRVHLRPRFYRIMAQRAKGAKAGKKRCGNILTYVNVCKCLNLPAYSRPCSLTGELQRGETR